MDAMLHALVGILLRAVPTFFLVILLHYYLKSMFFKPLEKVLHERYQATEGARQSAEKSLADAAAKTAHYEAELQKAKTQMYQSQERLSKELQDREAAAIAEARKNADATVKQAKTELDAEMESARGRLATDSDALANQIADTVLRRNAA
jgi:F-type H+-transporting ATPase subunit b